MKKMLISISFATLIMVGCSAPKNDTTEPKQSSSSSSVLVEQESIASSSNEVKVINQLNTSGAIEKDGKTMYTLDVTEVVDVTEEVRNKLINDTNYLDFYSSNQAKQAVRITIKMTNSSGITVGSPYLDEIKVKDSEGITNVGGWKDDGSTITEFGLYQLDGENGEVQADMYETEDGESKLATSTVLLATPSEKISFVFDSQRFNDEILFELPVTK